MPCLARWLDADSPAARHPGAPGSSVDSRSHPRPCQSRCNRCLVVTQTAHQASAIAFGDRHLGVADLGPPLVDGVRVQPASCPARGGLVRRIDLSHVEHLRASYSRPSRVHSRRTVASGSRTRSSNRTNVTRGSLCQLQRHARRARPQASDGVRVVIDPDTQRLVPRHRLPFAPETAPRHRIFWEAITARGSRTMCTTCARRIRSPAGDARKRCCAASARRGSACRLRAPGACTTASNTPAGLGSASGPEIVRR